MDQSEIDALLKAAGSQPAAAKPKKSKDAPAAAAAPAQPASHAPAQGHGDASPEGQVISELDAVTAVTERETNKVMDQLDLISQLVGRQQALITEVMQQPGAQDKSVQEAIREIMASGKEIQDKVFEAMDLMQFQDITRQKLERIVFHLRQIHDYIVDLLGTGLKDENERASISHTIQTTGTRPDEQKAHADAVVEEFMKRQKKG
jgi:hypothetical protein